MTIAHSSQAVTEVSSPLDTGGIPRTEPVMDIPGPRSSEWFTEQNRDFMNYTHTDRENGSSEPFAPKQASYFYFTPAAKPLREYFLALQKWEGYVTEVGSVTFRARLHVLLGEGSDQEAEIYIEEISPADRGLIEPGAVFYWTIGYLDRPSGRLRASEIRFRRLPVWSKQEIEAAEKAATRLKILLDGSSEA